MVVGGCLGDNEKIFEAGEATCASPDFGFGLVADGIINIGEKLLKLNTEKVSAEGPWAKILGNSPCEVASGGHLSSSSHLSLLRSLLAEFWDRVGAVGQEVTLDVKYLGSIDERRDSLW